MSMKDNLKGAMRERMGGLSATKTNDSIFASTANPATAALTVKKEEVEEVEQIQVTPIQLTAKVPKKKKALKCENMEKVIVPMTYLLKEASEKMARQIKKNGKQKQERITANSVIRSMLHLLTIIDVDVSNVDSEDSLKEAILKAAIEVEG